MTAPDQYPYTYGRCQGDWQGPSDDECVDDLLVIQCENPVGPTRGSTRCGQVHQGVYDGRIVRWISPAADLVDQAGAIVRRQFRD